MFPKSFLRWLTEQKNPKFLLNFAKGAARYKEGLFWVFKTNLSIFRVISFYAPWKFLLCLGNSAWDFLGDKFWSSDILGFWFLPPFDHPCHLKSGVPPLGLRTLNFSHFPSQVNLYFSDWKLCGGEQWKNQTFLKPQNASKIENSREFCWILTLVLKSPFHGILDIGQFHSPQMKPWKSPDYFIKVSFHIVVGPAQFSSWWISSN